VTKLTRNVDDPTPTEAEPELLPDEVDAAPYHLDRAMLRELGSCGDYIRKHRELFPPSEFPDGPPINSVTCRTYVDQFDWHWAMEQMLDWDGRSEVHRITNSRAQQYRALGPGREGNKRRFAAAFGYVFATQPQHRSTVMSRLRDRADQHAEERAHEDLREARDNIRTIDRRVKELLESKARYEADLPELEAAVENVKVRAAERAAARKERELREATARLETLQREAREARAAADALAATPAEATTGETP
jgi:hypothetical protein